MGGLATWAPTDRDQPPRLQSTQAMTDIALIASQALHQFEMSGANTALGAFILRPHTAEDVALQFRKAPCRHESSLLKRHTRRLRLSAVGALDQPVGSGPVGRHRDSHDTDWGNRGDYEV